MDNFVAVDVEKANTTPGSICAIGAVKVINGVVSESFYELVRPEPNWYLRRFTDQVHGLSRKDTDGARTFPEVWRDLQSRIIGTLPLVAHNKAFDESAIRAAHRIYGMEYPGYTFLCTLQKARKTIPRQLIGSYSLPYLCDFLGIPFANHHNALADAVGCAKIAMTLL